jgi:hypothetical protein
MPRTILFSSESDRVNHAVFGLGTIRRVDERRTTIAFDDSRTRIFVTNMAQLEHSSTPPPPKPARGREANAARKD